jgi:hypothetical protein
MFEIFFHLLPVVSLLLLNGFKHRLPTPETMKPKNIMRSEMLFTLKQVRYTIGVIWPVLLT